MVSATHVIMTVHPVLVLLPILGLLVLPCAPLQLVNGLRIVANGTAENPGKCDPNNCPKDEVCPKAIVNTTQSVGFLISCLKDTQNCSFGNDTNFNNLLMELCVISNDSFHGGKNQMNNSALPNQSAGHSSSPNITQPLPTQPNFSISRTSTSTDPTTLHPNSTTIATTNLQTTPTEKATTTDTVPKPATTIPTTPAVTSTNTTTPNPTTTSPKPFTKTTSSTTTVAQTIIPKLSTSTSHSGTNMSASISPSVPTTPSITPTTKPNQTSAASSDENKPSQTSLSPSVVVSALPKDIPKGDKAMIEVAGDPLTSHLLNTSSLLAVLLFGLLFLVVTVAMFLKQAYESYKRKDYTQVDYLINGMYSDSGV